ncbi:MAG: dihydrofolate reductase [Candidatus Aceula meridiana]|nr:dihydrofolate reductase [Candidatus Aceula meridiana]
MKTFSIIVAVDEKNGIGKNGCLPWNLPEDMKHFKEVTTTTKDPLKINAVIMGRKTWESIPEKFRPLKERINVVLTRNEDLELESSALKAGSFAEALNILSGSVGGQQIETIFVIGGASIYQEALASKRCDKIYLTQIFKAFECDTFFQEFRSEFIQKQTSEMITQDSFEYQFTVFEPRR